MAKNDEITFSLGDDDEELTTETTVKNSTSSDDVGEETSKEPTKEPAITFDLEEQKAPEPKKVKIKVKQHLNTSIGGVWYELHPGKEISVPPHVRDILRNAGYLEAL